MRTPRSLFLLLLLCAATLPAQQVALAPDSLTLAVGDTSRVVATVRGAAALRLSYRGTNATAFTVHRDGRITARAVGCGYVRVGVVDSTWSRGQVRVCVVAAAPAPTPPPTPTPGTLALSSDWSTATGSTDAALTDGGRWNASGQCMLDGENRVLRVVPGAPLGWTRTPNVLRVSLHDVPPSPGCGQVEWIDRLPASTTHWGRFYYANDERAMISSHNFSQNFGVGDPGPIQWVFFNRHGFADGWEMLLRGRHVGGTYPFNEWHLQHSANMANRVRLPHHVWYRYEWMVEYVAANRIRIHPRVYDLAGTLLYDGDDFYQQDTPAMGVHTLTSWYAAGNSFAVGDVDLARNVGIGNEGRQPGSATGHWYIAEFAISTAGWIGR